MKKIVTTTLITSALLAFASNSFAVGTADAQSFATAGVSTSSYSAGNGFSAQSAEAGAGNQSYAGAGYSSNNLNDASFQPGFPGSWSLTVGEVSKADTIAGSEGGSYSQVSGVQFGNASGSSVAGAGQFGRAEADATVFNSRGFMDISSEATVGSGSASLNTGWGFAANGTQVSAENVTTGLVGGSTTIAGPVAVIFPLPTTSIVDKSIADVTTGGNTASGSYDIDFGAVGVTGGFATQNGVGVAVAP